MMDDIADPQLFMRFVELDGSTAGKNREPIHWFRGELEKRGYELPQPPRTCSGPPPAGSRLVPTQEDEVRPFHALSRR